MAFSVTSIMGFVSGLMAQASKPKEEDKPVRMIRLDPVKIEGKIQKPEAFYIMQRGNLPFESLDLKKSFLPKIWEAVDKEPF